MRDCLWSNAVNWQEKILAKNPKFVPNWCVEGVQIWNLSWRTLTLDLRTDRSPHPKELELLIELWVWGPQKLPPPPPQSPELQLHFSLGFEEFQTDPPSEFFLTIHGGFGQCVLISDTKLFSYLIFFWRICSSVVLKICKEESLNNTGET